MTQARCCWTAYTGLNAPKEAVFAALCDFADWLPLAPHEVAPRVTEQTRPIRVVWSSLWPVSPDDTIEFDLSAAGSNHTLHSRAPHTAAPQTLLRVRWTTRRPPDARGIAITRYRLNRYIGGALRGAQPVGDFYWHGQDTPSDDDAP